jgi:Pilus assembly protein, PilO
MTDRLTNRNLLVLTGIGFVALLLVGWFLLVSPHRSHAATLDRQIDDANAQLRLAQALDDPKVKRARAVDIRRVELAMPMQVDMPGILRQLAWAGRTAHVRVEGVLPQAAVPTSGYQVIPMTVSIEGHFFAITQFLNLLHTRAQTSVNGLRASGRLFGVDGITFTGGVDKPVLAAQLVINAFSFVGTPAVGVPGAIPPTAAAPTAMSAAP